MVTKKNLTDIVRKLVSHLEAAGLPNVTLDIGILADLPSTEGTSYRDEVLAKIIAICSQDKYKVHLIPST